MEGLVDVLGVEVLVVDGEQVGEDGLVVREEGEVGEVEVLVGDEVFDVVDEELVVGEGESGEGGGEQGGEDLGLVEEEVGGDDVVEGGEGGAVQGVELVLDLEALGEELGLVVGCAALFVLGETHVEEFLGVVHVGRRGLSAFGLLLLGEGDNEYKEIPGRVQSSIRNY